MATDPDMRARLAARLWRATPRGDLAWNGDLVRRSLARSRSMLHRHACRILRDRKWAPPAFDGRPIRRLYGDRQQPGHVLRVDPLEWGFHLAERQVTAALVHFLNRGDVVLRRRAFLRAFGCGADAADGDLAAARVIEEHRTRHNRRIDILVTWTQGADREAEKHGLAIEAKFRHQISRGQLSEYRAEMRRRGLAHPILVVVAPERRRSDEKHLRRNRSWRLATWRSAMLKFERALGNLGGDSDTEFARLRKTIWQRQTTGRMRGDRTQ